MNDASPALLAPIATFLFWTCVSRRERLARVGEVLTAAECARELDRMWGFVEQVRAGGAALINFDEINCGNVMII